jgi:hypothetical protein
MGEGGRYWSPTFQNVTGPWLPFGCPLAKQGFWDTDLAFFPQRVILPT